MKREVYNLLIRTMSWRLRVLCVCTNMHSNRTFNGTYIGCSFWRLIRRPEYLIDGNSWQNEGHSFGGDHLSSESVSVTPSSVIEAFIEL
jgi:hypothetical protein